MFAAKNHAKRSCRYRVRGVANFRTLTPHATTPFDSMSMSPIHPFLSSKDKIAAQFFPSISHCDIYSPLVNRVLERSSEN